ncbi:MAG: serine hydrolase, partial [Pseudomonadota bacterium]
MRYAILVLAISMIGSCSISSEMPYPHESEEIGSVRDVYSASLAPEIQVNTFRNTHRLFATRKVERGSSVSEMPYTVDTVSDIRFESNDQTYSFQDYITLNRVGGLLVIGDGQIVHESYHLGNTEETRWMSMSVAKTITAMLVGAAVKDGFIESLEDPVTKYVETLQGTSYDEVSVRNLLNMTSGVKWDETYTNAESDRRRLLEAQLKQEPGAMLEVMASLPRVAEPGSVWNYSTGETQVVAELVQSATGTSLSDYLSEKIWSPFGMESDATWWLDAPGGVEVGGSGLATQIGR